MAWRNDDRESVARIRAATRRRCIAATVHNGHTHMCEGNGDHNGFGDEVPHTAKCGDGVFTWYDRVTSTRRGK